MRLRALAETFAKQLPGRMKDIADAARASLSDEPPPNSLVEFRMNVHKLAGSAASFGFHHVTVCAKRLEHIIDMVMEDGGRADGNTRKKIRMLVSELGDSTRSHAVEEEELEELAEDFGDPVAVAPAIAETPATAGSSTSGERDAAPIPRGEPLEDLTSSESGGLTPIVDATADTESMDPGLPERRFVAILVRFEQLEQELSDQLKFYGFNLHRANSVDDLVAATENDCHLAFVLDAGALLADPATVDRIGAMKTKCGDRLRIIYISDRDDYQTRLLAARTGGEAFLTGLRVQR